MTDEFMKTEAESSAETKAHNAYLDFINFAGSRTSMQLHAMMFRAQLALEDEVDALKVEIADFMKKAVPKDEEGRVDMKAAVAYVHAKIDSKRPKLEEDFVLSLKRA